MSAALTALSEELSKIAAVSEEKNKKPSYLRAVGAGLPLVFGQAISDVPEGILERSVQNQILKSRGLPRAGSLYTIGPLRFASRIGAGALTTPLFISGMKDISSAKNKEQERRGLGKVIAAGGAYSALRGGIEMALDSEYKHLTPTARLQRVVGPKALRGLASAAATGLMVGRSLKSQKEEPNAYNAYIKPALAGGGIAGLSGLYEAGIAEGLKTPQARWRVGAKVGGKAAAGAVSALVLSELLKKMIGGKEKKAQVTSGVPGTSAMYDEVAHWAGGASTEDIQRFVQSLISRGENRSPSNRSALAAAYAELKKRGVQIPNIIFRAERPKEKPIPAPGPLDVSILLGVAAAPSLAWKAISSLPQTDRDRVLVDALDRMHIANKIQVTNVDEGLPVVRGAASAFPDTRLISVAKDVDPAELAHEIGHINAGSLRKATLQNPVASSVRIAASAASVALPVFVMASSLDKTNSTEKELESKAKAVAVLGVASAAAQTPALAEELTASAKGLKYLADVGATRKELITKALTVLGPAFATYAAPVAVPFVAAGLLKRKAKRVENARK